MANSDPKDPATQADVAFLAELIAENQKKIEDLESVVSQFGEEILASIKDLKSERKASDKHLINLDTHVTKIEDEELPRIKQHVGLSA